MAVTGQRWLMGENNIVACLSSSLIAGALQSTSMKLGAKNAFSWSLGQFCNHIAIGQHVEKVHQRTGETLFSKVSRVQQTTQRTSSFSQHFYILSFCDVRNTGFLSMMYLLQIEKVSRFCACASYLLLSQFFSRYFFAEKGLAGGRQKRGTHKNSKQLRPSPQSFLGRCSGVVQGKM